MNGRALLALPLALLALSAPSSVAAAPFPTDFSVIGLHDDTFYGLDREKPAVVKWLNKRTGARGEMSTGGVRSDIFSTASFGNQDVNTVFSSTGMAVGTSPDLQLDQPRQLYRITRAKGFELLENLGGWSHQTCGAQTVPLNIDSRGEVTAVELSISRKGGACTQVDKARIVRYDSGGTRSEIPVSATLRSWIRWRSGPTNIIASDRYVAIASRVSKKRPQSRLAILDSRTGKLVRQLNAAPRGFTATIEFATPDRLLVSSRIPGRRGQIKHIPVKGSARVIKRGTLPSIFRACGMRTASTDRSFAFWLYDSRGRQLRKIVDDGYSEPSGMLCSRQYLYFYFLYWSEDGSESSTTSGLVDLTRLR